MGSSWPLLAGRVTHEHFAKVWPNAPKPNPFTDALNRVQKYVVSSTLKEPLPREHSTLLGGDGVSAVRELKRTHDKPLVVFGSGVLFIDVPSTQFHLADSVIARTGVLIDIYERVSAR